MSDNTSVYLIGAGPGDPGLLTVRGRECLELADVVVHDDHVPAAMLKWSGGRRKSSTVAGKWNEAAKPIRFSPSTTSAQAVCRTQYRNFCMDLVGEVT